MILEETLLRNPFKSQDSHQKGIHNLEEFQKRSTIMITTGLQGTVYEGNAFCVFYDRKKYWQHCLSRGGGTQLETCKEKHIAVTPQDSGCHACYFMTNHLELKGDLAGTGLTPSSSPGAPCKSAISASLAHSDLQLEPWRSHGPSARLSSRLQASQGENLPLTVGSPFSVSLEQYQDNARARERESSYGVCAGNSPSNPQ